MGSRRGGGQSRWEGINEASFFLTSPWRRRGGGAAGSQVCGSVQKEAAREAASLLTVGALAAGGPDGVSGR